MLTSITITGSRSGCKRTVEKSEYNKYYNEKKSSSLIASDFTLHLKTQKEKKKNSGRVQKQEDNIRISKKNQQNKWMQIKINISFTISKKTKLKTNGISIFMHNMDACVFSHSVLPNPLRPYGQ